jgi:4-amino-4-deoxy-L-arabinose transferase-like glycosyltransferase
LPAAVQSEPDRERRARLRAYLFFFAAFALVVFLIHLPYLGLPFFWDETGQFVPASLDLFRHGFWVPRSATPNVHPPGLMAYLALVWGAFGFSIPATRAAMLAVAAGTVFATFLLAIRLCRRKAAAPAFAAVLLLVASPLFYTQSMMAQLDLPATLLTLIALLLFLDSRYAAAAAASTALVLVKETGIVAPAVFGAWLWFEGERRRAAWFLAPLAALAGWLFVLFRATGHLFGNSQFTDYNLFFPLNPLRVAVALARRIFYLGFDSFHWIGWLSVAFAWRRMKLYASRPWRIAGAVAAAQILAVSVLGGAVLERYLLPVLPLMYIAFAAAWGGSRSLWTRVARVALPAGLVLSLFWALPFSYPFENNLAMVDFVRLHQRAAAYIERNYPDRTITTAWPLSIELRRPYLGYTSRAMKVREIPEFRAADIGALDPRAVEVFVLYTREWDKGWALGRFRFLRGFLRRLYRFEPPVTPEDAARRLRVAPVAAWTRAGQWIEVFERAPR